MSKPQYEYLIDKPRFNAPDLNGPDAFYDERNDTVLILIGGSRVTLTPEGAWNFLHRLEAELHGADYDRKDD